MYLQQQKMCEDCGKKRKMCEDCGVKLPSFGQRDDTKRRWCSTCAESHDGAVRLHQQKMCEDCGEKVPSFGYTQEKKKRWCATCRKAHDGAVSLQQQKMCEDCGAKQPSFGYTQEKKKRWCATELAARAAASWRLSSVSRARASWSCVASCAFAARSSACSAFFFAWYFAEYPTFLRFCSTSAIEAPTRVAPPDLLHAAPVAFCANVGSFAPPAARCRSSYQDLHRAGRAKGADPDIRICLVRNSAERVARDRSRGGARCSPP
eukprot:COSAG06_NODE_4026_length_4648_cov_4.871400_2_plen_263_part_00